MNATAMEATARLTGIGVLVSRMPRSLSALAPVHPGVLATRGRHIAQPNAGYQRDDVIDRGLARDEIARFAAQPDNEDAVGKLEDMRNIVTD